MLFGAGTGRVILNSWLHNVKNSAYCIFLQAFFNCTWVFIKGVHNNHFNYQYLFRKFLMEKKSNGGEEVDNVMNLKWDFSHVGLAWLVWGGGGGKSVCVCVCWGGA